GSGSSGSIVIDSAGRENGPRNPSQCPFFAKVACHASARSETPGGSGKPMAESLGTSRMWLEGGRTRNHGPRLIASPRPLVSMAAMTVAEMFWLRNCTDPSANTAFAPPWWNEYIFTVGLLTQLMARGEFDPFAVVQSAVIPSNPPFALP